MFRHISLLIVSMLLFCSLSVADENINDGLFLSLTRTEERIENLPTNISVITSQQIKQKDARDLREVLENETGLTLSHTGTMGQLSNPSFRGSTPEQVLVLIDGRRINRLSDGIVDFSNIPVDNIERIEIIRGAASAVYGTSAFGGVINIITRKPTENTPIADFSISGGNFNTQSYQFNSGIARDNVSGLISASKSFSDGWRQNSDYENQNFFARVGYGNEDLGHFDLSGSVFRSNLGSPGMAETVPNTFMPLTVDKYNGNLEKMASTPHARQKDGTEYARLEYTKGWEAGSVKTAVSIANDKLSFYDPNPVWPQNDDYNSAVWGGEFQYTTRSGITTGCEWGQEKYRHIDPGTSIVKNDKSRTNTALFLQDELLMGQFSLIPGLRFDENSAFGSVISPRVTIVYRIDENFKASANTGKSWRAPTFNELYYPPSFGFQGNPDLKPEEGISSDCGIEYATKYLKSSLSLFLTSTRNLIVWGWTTTENIGKSRQQGVEFDFSGRISNGLTHKLNYTYLEATDTETDQILNYKPRNTINYGISYMPLLNTQITLGAQFVSTQRTGSISAPELPEYTTVNVKVQQRVSLTELWLKIDNMLNTQYQTRAGYPLPGLIISGGVNLRFWS